MEETSEKSITLTREAEGVYVARSPGGAELRFGHNVPGAFSSVELLMVALAGCSATDVDMVTSRRAEPTVFDVTVTADKVGGTTPAILRNVVAEFDVQFPEGEAGDKARDRVVPALQAAHDRTCTVSRTIQNAVDVEFRTV
jgi:uncharacterized OsmC-like protein